MRNSRHKSRFANIIFASEPVEVFLKEESYRERGVGVCFFVRKRETRDDKKKIQTHFLRK